MTDVINDAARKAFVEKVKGGFPSKYANAMVELLNDTLIESLFEGSLDDNFAAFLAGDAADAIASAAQAGVYAEFLAPAAPADGAILASTALADGEVTILDDPLADFDQPDVPRQIRITPTMAGVSLTGDVVIVGLDADGEELIDTIALADDAVMLSAGFSAISSITLPARVTEGDEVAVGTTAYLAFPVALAGDSIYLALENGSKAPAYTLEPSATLSECLIAPETTPDGTIDYRFYYHI